MEEEGDDIDMISSLPDEILRHIVSFLATREAFATTVLSKRWKSVWQWASGTSACIDFDDGCYTKSRDSYHLFIRTVCLACLAFEFYRNLPLQKFRLCFRSPQFYIPAFVWQWLNMAVIRRVQHLDLSLHFPSYLINRRPTDLSPILRCTNLVVLKLHGFDLQPFPNSSSLHFPLLQVLHLQQMIFSQRDTLAHLLSASPNLHDFKATGLRFDNYVTHRKFQTSPKLLRAHVSATQTCFLITEVVYNAHFLHLDNISHRLLYEPHWMYHYSSFPIFHNLIHLQLVYQPYNAHWSQVVQLLHHFPKLQLLVINQPDIHSFHFEQIEKIGDCQFPPSVPPCLLLSLKRCCLNDYRGTKPEFEFARYIMHNGICLKNMTISTGTAKDRKFKMLKELSSCKRGSATCKLSFK